MTTRDASLRIAILAQQISDYHAGGCAGEGKTLVATLVQPGANGWVSIRRM